jgi:hypothetical protein
MEVGGTEIPKECSVSSNGSIEGPETKHSLLSREGLKDDMTLTWVGGKRKYQITYNFFYGSWRDRDL